MPREKRNRSPQSCGRGWRGVDTEQSNHSEILPRMLTHLTQALTISIQHIRNRYEDDTEERQRTTHPIHAQIFVHHRRKEREPRAEGAAHEVVAGEY